MFGQLWFGLAAVAASLVLAQVIWGAATSDADQDLGTVAEGDFTGISWGHGI